MFLAGSALASWAWHDTGHMVIGRIAEREMTADPAKVNALLANLPAKDAAEGSFGYPTLGAGSLGSGPELAGQPSALDWASVWPDKVRRTWMDRPDWHYINYPVLGPGGKAPAERPGNVEKAIVAMVEFAKNTGNPANSRAVALAWVCHLIGDLHMPLHATAYYSSLHPEGDRGGNIFFLRKDPVTHKWEPRKDWNLHTFWDKMGKAEDLGVSVILDRVLDLNFGTPRYTNLNQIQANVGAWARESLQIAKTSAYKEVKNGWLVPLSPFATTVSPEYQRRAQEVSLERVNQAGRRLAAVIDYIFRD